MATNSLRGRNATAALTNCSFTNSRVQLLAATAAVVRPSSSCGDLVPAMLATVISLQASALVKLTDSTFRGNVHALSCANIFADGVDGLLYPETPREDMALPAVYSNSRPLPQLLRLTPSGSRDEAAQRESEFAEGQFPSSNDAELKRIEQARSLCAPCMRKRHVYSQSSRTLSARQGYSDRHKTVHKRQDVRACALHCCSQNVVMCRRRRAGAGAGSCCGPSWRHQRHQRRHHGSRRGHATAAAATSATEQPRHTNRCWHRCGADRCARCGGVHGGAGTAPWLVRRQGRCAGRRRYRGRRGQWRAGGTCSASRHGWQR